MSEHLVGGEWSGCRGSVFRSLDPASGEIVWQGRAADDAQCREAVVAARHAFAMWSDLALAERIAVVRRFATVLGERRAALAQTISRETGKLLWESEGEVGAMIAKVEVSIAAQAERAGTRAAATDFGQAVLRHRPHGVMAVLGPYNFPGHLPNGHIVPALLAGNTIVFKPSEKTPAVAAATAEAWEAAGLPAGVLNLVQGGRETGAALLAQPIAGLLFTGSAGAGAQFRRAFVDRPEVILALELGGNNPLIVWDGDPEAAASIIVQSAFVTTGQRCSCARRLILPEGAVGDRMVEALDAVTARIRIAAWNEETAFMGPLIDASAADDAMAAIGQLGASGGRIIRPMQRLERGDAFVTPALIDMTGTDMSDREVFAPLLQIVRVPDFASAIAAANATRFGLSAGLVSDDPALWERFASRIRAGVVNRNRPTTGAASNMPFGGMGDSGNHRPSAYYAADYAAFPVASFEADAVSPVPVPGLRD